MTSYSYLVCGQCGINFAVDEIVMHNRRQGRTESNRTFYCPNGHPRCFGESSVDIARRRAEKAEQQLARLAEELEAERKLLALSQKQVKRFKKRASGGVCFCCNRTFANVTRHIKTKHPDFNDAANNVVKLKGSK